MDGSFQWLWVSECLPAHLLYPGSWHVIGTRTSSYQTACFHHKGEGDDSTWVFSNWNRLWEIFLCCSKRKILQSWDTGSKARVLLEYTGECLKGTPREFGLMASPLSSSVLPCGQLWFQKERIMECFGAESSYTWQQIPSSRGVTCWESHAVLVTKRTKPLHGTKRTKPWHGTAELQTHIQATAQKGSLAHDTHGKIDGVSISPFFPISNQLLTHTETITLQLLVPQINLIFP